MSDQRRIVEIIENLHHTGGLNSTATSFIHESRNEGWYKGILSARGKRDAELELHKRWRELHLTEFSEAICSIALGVKALAHVDLGKTLTTLTDVTDPGGAVLPLMREAGPGGVLIIASNPEWDERDTVVPEGFDTFSRYGALKLDKVALAISKSAEVTLGLVFDCRTVSDLSKLGYTVITIKRSGQSSSRDVVPYISREEFIQRALGINSKSPRFCTVQQGGSMSNLLGFPGSSQYLADRMIHMGTYLTAVATHFKEWRR